MRNRKTRRVLPLAAALMAALMAGLTGCGQAAVEQRGNIVFADAGWDSNRFHNAVAGLIAQEAYGYTWSETTGSTSVTVEGVKKGEIDVNMETWSDNIATYESDIASGAYQLLGTNFDDNIQGLYVPRYVIEGDAERGIEPMAPDLKTVKDLLGYSDLFVDEEDPAAAASTAPSPAGRPTMCSIKNMSSTGWTASTTISSPARTLPWRA